MLALASPCYLLGFPQQLWLTSWVAGRAPRKKHKTSSLATGHPEPGKVRCQFSKNQPFDDVQWGVMMVINGLKPMLIDLIIHRLSMIVLQQNDYCNQPWINHSQLLIISWIFPTMNHEQTSSIWSLWANHKLTIKQPSHHKSIIHCPFNNLTIINQS